MIKSNVRYSATDKLRDIIEDNNQLLLVLNRFRIPFGFGDKTVGEVCDKQGIDCSTFLAVADLVSGKSFAGIPVDLPTLMAYLRQAHSYILDFRLPDIRETLILAVHLPLLDNVAMLIIKFFDDYVEEVRNHMDYEDRVVFPYIESLLRGEPSEFSIAEFASKHESVVSKLNELKDIFLQHYTMPNTRMLNRALFNINACGDDLVSHCEIENRLLVPAVEALEKEATARRENAAVKETSASDTERPENLSEREKEIVCLVAQGLTNKEIADRLFLSFHTITTYRKNISAKLNIHSTAALTIYAIVQGLVDPREVELK